MDIGKEVHRAWVFLENHVMFQDDIGFSCFHRCLDIDIVRVNPETGEIDDHPDKNTKTEYWLECGSWLTPAEYKFNGFEHGQKHRPYGMAAHDYDLDCGGDTFEEAILNLACLVYENYGE